MVNSQGKVEKVNGFVEASKERENSAKIWGSPKAIFQALVTFLL